MVFFTIHARIALPIHFACPSLIHIVYLRSSLTDRAISTHKANFSPNVISATSPDVLGTT